MNEYDGDLDAVGVFYLDGGTPPEGLLEAVRRHRDAHPRLAMPAPTTSEVESFFANAAEEVKRAGGAR